MDEIQDKQSNFQKIMASAKNKLFTATLELLRDKKIGNSIISLGQWYLCFLMLITFIQLFGYLFDANVSV